MPAPVTPETTLERLAVDLSRAFAPPIPFPSKPERERPDPLAMTLQNAGQVVADFQFALAEAFNAGDRDSLATLQGQLSRLIEALELTERMGSDFETRMR
jgi:hypothetical protein